MSAKPAQSPLASHSFSSYPPTIYGAPIPYIDSITEVMSSSSVLEGLEVTEKIPDGRQRFLYEWKSGPKNDDVVMFLYGEPINNRAGRLLITCQGDYFDDATKEYDFHCIADGGNFGEFDGRVDVQAGVSINPQKLRHIWFYWQISPELQIP